MYRHNSPLELSIMKSGKLGAILCGLILIALSFSTCSGQNQVSFEVGATSDDASRGNIGIRVDIQTHLYETYPVVFDYFWIGSVLTNGGFLQFGYGFQPGPATYCLRAFVKNGVSTCMGKSELVSNTEGRWEWQYWPNVAGHDFNYEIGPANSVGTNGSWHEYSIVRSNSEWDFVFDDVIVGNIMAPASPSRDPPLIVAEKTGTMQLVGSLGPVEFQRLEYLNENGWNSAESLFAVRSCLPNPECNLDQPYGVRMVGDHVLVGSVNERPNDGELLWTEGLVKLNVIAHPDTRFNIWTYAGQHLFVDNGTVQVPKGMFAYVSLIDTRVPASGLLGFLGVKDEFQGWTGSRTSNNVSMQILMKDDNQLRAVWRSDYLEFVLIILAPVLVIIGLAVHYVLTKRRRSS
jgi:hypothetical protein